MSRIFKIKMMLKRERMQEAYARKDRVILPPVYFALKQKKKCEHCGARLEHRPHIHHKISVSHGGSNDVKNLMAICPACHEVLDGQWKK